jgi:hypothetical protein
VLLRGCDRLAALADREGTPQAEVIRRAIRLYEPERKGDRNFALIGVADGPGGSIADVPAVELLEGRSP